MKRCALLALSISLVLLSGCKSTEKYEEQYEQWKTSYLAEAEQELDAEVTVSDDEGVCQYKLHYTRSGEEQTIEVLEPQLITKVKARLKDDKAQLSYEGAILDSGSTVPQQLSPMMALPTFMKFIKEGHFETGWRETIDDTDMLVTELELPDGSRMTFWQRAADMSPAIAAIRSGKKLEVKILF